MIHPSNLVGGVPKGPGNNDFFVLSLCLIWQRHSFRFHNTTTTTAKVDLTSRPKVQITDYQVTLQLTTSSIDHDDPKGKQTHATSTSRNAVKKEEHQQPQMVPKQRLDDEASHLESYQAFNE
jgi:hypothetical protein